MDLRSKCARPSRHAKTPALSSPSGDVQDTCALRCSRRGQVLGCGFCLYHGFTLRPTWHWTEAPLRRAVGRLGVARMVRLGIAQMDRSGIAFCRRLVAHACVLICLLAMYVYIHACASMYALVCACRRVYRMTYVTCMFHDTCYYVCWRVHVCGCVHAC